MANSNSERHSNSRLVDGFLVFFLAIASISIFSAGLIPYAVLLGDFPGANLPLAFVIASIMGLLLVFIYSSIGTFFPQYGADYVMISRVLAVPLGFAASFTILIGVVMLTSGLTGNMAFIAMPVISKTASITANAGFSIFEGLHTPTGVMAVGSILILMAFAVSLFPIRIAQNFLRLGFFLTLLSWAGLLFQVAVPMYSFTFGWDKFMGFGAYDRQVFLARQSGMPTGPFPNSFLPLGLIATAILFIGVFMPVWMAKEVKTPQKDFLFGNLGAILLASILFILTALLILRLIPTPWLASQSYLYLVTEEGKESVYPWLIFYANILRPNPWLAYLFLIGWAVSIFNLTLVTIMAGSRLLMAWAKDKILPVSFSFLHRTLETPVVSLLWMALLLEMGLMIFALTHTHNIENIKPFFFVIASGQVVSAIALAIFPLKFPERFQKISGPAGWKIGKVPLVSLASLIWIIYGVYLLNFLAINPRGFDFRPFGWILGSFAFGFVLFALRKSWLKKRGIDLDSGVINIQED